MSLCIRNRFAQIFVCLCPCLKQVGVLCEELGRDRAVAFNVQRKRRIRTEILVGCDIVPAAELIACGRRRDQLIGAHRILFVAELLGNSLSIHGIGAILCREEGCSRFNVGRQRNIGQRDLGGSAGAVRLDIYTDRSASSKLFGECTTRSNGGSVHLNRAALCIDGIVKTQDSSNTALVGNC